MKIVLKDRTEENVRLYFEKSQQNEIKQMLPQKAKTVEEAVEDFYKTKLPNSTSYGKTIYVEDVYVGDVWCYCIDKTETPNAMLSFCIFNKTYWQKGIASISVSLFLKNIHEKYKFETIGAFTFSNNIASQRVLEKNDFSLIEEFDEDGRLSRYYERLL